MLATDLVEDRHRRLLERLEQQRGLSTADAAVELGTSVDTIRRDLRALHEQGLLRRVHGGAVPLSRLSPSFAGRTSDESPGRAKLAAVIVNHFRSGQLIGLDAGTTTTEVAAQIPSTLDLTIVTNSPTVALQLEGHRRVDVVLIGGTVDLTWMATTGPDAVDAWRSYHLDLAVVGVCAFDPVIGASTRSRNEVTTKRALIAAAAETIVPVETDKFGTGAPFHVVDAAEVDTLVVERDAGEAHLAHCRTLGLQIITAQ